MAIPPDRIDATEETYRLLRSAVTTRSPISAIYHDYERLLCPHRLGWNKMWQPRVQCYQYGGESETGLEPVGSPANWRCMAVDDLNGVELLEGPWYTAPNHSRPQTCVAVVDVDADDQPERDPQKGQ